MDIQKDTLSTSDRLSNYHLTPEQIAFFDENGYLILRNWVTGELLQRLQGSIAINSQLPCLRPPQPATVVRRHRANIGSFRQPVLGRPALAGPVGILWRRGSRPTGRVDRPDPACAPARDGATDQDRA